MNTIVIVRKISLFFIFIVIMNCSLFYNTHEARTIKGVIFITGNEPFTRLALEDINGNVYYLQCSEEMVKKLWDLQGQEVLIYYNSINTNETGTFVKVKKYIIDDKEH
ncbi:MAG: hypothetical protein R6V04_01330 [bacterium]